MHIVSKISYKVCTGFINIYFFNEIVKRLVSLNKDLQIELKKAKFIHKHKNLGVKIC